MTCIYKGHSVYIQRKTYHNIYRHCMALPNSICRHGIIKRKSDMLTHTGP